MTINVIRIREEAIPESSVISQSVANVAEDSLPVVEMFYGIEGEGLYVGQPRILVRLGGCRIKCHGCDSPQTWNANKNSKMYTLPELRDEIVTMAKQYHVRTVAITGGEPMHYPAQLAWLCAEFDRHGIKPWIETSGYYMLSPTAHFNCIQLEPLKHAFWSYDIKTPSSRDAAFSMADVNKFFHELENTVNRIEDYNEYQVKFIATDLTDLDFIRDVVSKYSSLLPFIVITPACGVKGTAEDVSRTTEMIMKYVAENGHVFPLNRVRVIAQQHQLLNMR